MGWIHDQVGRDKECIQTFGGMENIHLGDQEGNIMLRLMLGKCVQWRTSPL
jgi:hypothetical protein